MHRTLRFTLLGSVVALCASCGGGGGSSSPPPASSPPPRACTAAPASTQPADSLAGIVDSAVAAEMQAQSLPGMTVAIARHGEILYSHAYGYADLGSCRQMQPTDPMQIGSITKQFTASAVLQLQEAGKIDLDRAVIDYLPDYAFDPRITVRMLLNQTSGLVDYLNFTALEQFALTGGPESVVLTAVAAEKVRFDPGTAFEYSNSNYFILGSIIEAVSSQTYADYLGANVLPLAGLSHTTYLQPSNATSPYGSKLVGGNFAGVILHPSAYFSAGQLWSNVQDLASWNDAWLSGKVVSAPSIELMRTPADVPYFQSSIPSDYGMGWITHTPVSGHPFIWHNGGTTSYTSFTGVLTDTGFSLTVLTNYTVVENVPLLNFAEQLVVKVCDTPAAGGC